MLGRDERRHGEYPWWYFLKDEAPQDQLNRLMRDGGVEVRFKRTDVSAGIECELRRSRRVRWKAYGGSADATLAVAIRAMVRDMEQGASVRVNRMPAVFLRREPSTSPGVRRMALAAGHGVECLFPEYHNVVYYADEEASTRTHVAVYPDLPTRRDRWVMLHGTRRRVVWLEDKNINAD